LVYLGSYVFVNMTASVNMWRANMKVKLKEDKQK
jgi:hypothetical protein